MRRPVRAAPPHVTLALLAKAPVAGQVKTRLCPPCTPEEAALLAQACIEDTLEAMLGTPGARSVVVLDGAPGGWLPDGVPVVPQRPGGLAARLQGAADDLGGPLVLIGMDTPQVTSAQLGAAAVALVAPGTDALLGPATDGGYWLIGVRESRPGLFEGVSMSVDTTADEQRHRLRDLGLRWRELGVLRDVDGIADAREVACAIPKSRFARVMATMGQAGVTGPS